MIVNIVNTIIVVMGHTKVTARDLVEVAEGAKLVLELSCWDAGRIFHRPEHESL